MLTCTPQKPCEAEKTEKEVICKGTRAGKGDDAAIDVEASWRPQASRSAITVLTCKVGGKEKKLLSVSDLMAGNKKTGNAIIMKVMDQFVKRKIGVKELSQAKVDTMKKMGIADTSIRKRVLKRPAAALKKPAAAGQGVGGEDTAKETGHTPSNTNTLQVNDLRTMEEIVRTMAKFGNQRTEPTLANILDVRPGKNERLPGRCRQHQLNHMI